jgi:flagellar assembly protein FliH
LWDLPIVGEGDEPTKVVNADKLLPTAEDIEAMQEQAYKEAYDQAYEDAHKDGLEAGKKEGHDLGFQEGKAEGYQQGLKDAQADVNEKVAHLTSIIQTLSTPLQELDDEVEEELLYLAMTTARHLVRRELKIQPTHIIAAVRQAVDLLPISSQNVRVFLNPEDAALVREALSVSDDEEQRWKIVEDPMITRGGCNVETDHSRIDATIETRVNSVIAQVLGDERGSEDDDESGNEPE